MPVTAPAVEPVTAPAAPSLMMDDPPADYDAMTEALLALCPVSHTAKVFKCANSVLVI